MATVEAGQLLITQATPPLAEYPPEQLTAELSEPLTLTDPKAQENVWL